MTLFLELLALAGLILLNAFFVAAEYGLVTSRRTRIRELDREGNRRARAVLRITSDPPRFIAAMQLGVTITSLAIGALGEPVLAHRFEPVMATVLAVDPRAADHHVPARRDRRARARRGSRSTTRSGPRSPSRRPVRALLHRARAADLAARSARPSSCSASLGQEPPGAEHEAHSEAELRMLLSSSAEQGRDRARRAGDGHAVFDFADKEVERRDGAAAGGGRALGRPAARGGAAGRARLALHALPGLPRDGRRHRRRPARARPDRGDARPRARLRRRSRRSCARR